MLVSVQQSGLAAIGKFMGGAVDEAFRMAHSEAVRDCERRPFLDKARKITVVVELTPRPTDEGDAYETAMTAEVKSAVPSRKSKEVVARIGSNGDAVFNDLAEDNPLQRTIDEGE